MLTGLMEIKTMTKVNFRRNVATRVLNGMIADYRSIYRDAGEHAHSHEAVMETVRVRILDTERYRRLPSWAEAALWTAHYRVLFDDWQNAMIWTHVIDGERVHTKHASLDGRLESIVEGDSHHCYAYLVDERIVYVPMNDKDVETDIRYGRLSREDLRTVRSYRTPLATRLTLVGKVLCVMVPCNVEG